MTYNAINKLIVSIESSGHENFWKYEGEFFMLFYNRFKDTPFADIPDIAFIYMEINNWQIFMPAAYMITQMKNIRKTMITRRNGWMKRKE